MASLEKAVEEPLDILCEFRRYKALEAAGNNDNKNPTASSVEQVRIQWFLNYYLCTYLHTYSEVPNKSVTFLFWGFPTYMALLGLTRLFIFGKTYYLSKYTVIR